MNKFKTVAFAIIIAAGPAAAQAARVDQADLEECKEQVDQYYGGVESMRYVGQRRFMDGTQMKFAVHQSDEESGYTTTRLATCWLGADNLQANAAETDGPMVADVYDSVTSSIKDPLMR